MGTLLTSDALEWIGRQIEVNGDEITESMVQQYVYASEDDHPAYVSDTSADAVGTSRVVPPMLYQAATRPYVPLNKYSSDGIVIENRPVIGTGQSVGGTLAVQWVRPLKIGDRLSGLKTLVSMEEKAGSRRTFVVVTWETNYTDQKGEVVIRESYEQICF